ncbi:Septum site-determining protein MinC [Candidatus Entotheonellaceae bacterium PAL068K]
MTKPGVKFSGTDQGLLMQLEWDVPVPQLLVELEEHLQQSRAFFDGAQVLLEIGRQPVLAQDMEQLEVVLSRYGVTLRGVSPSPVDQQRLPPAPAAVAPAAPDPYTMVHFERRTVRSGEKIASEGHLFITGDVNPGAEVIAGYNIFVWGSLKGSAYAGVPDHEAAVIAALHLAPIQLRIAGYIARAPEARSTTVWAPELARIDDHAIVVEVWERGRSFQKRG